MGKKNEMIKIEKDNVKVLLNNKQTFNVFELLIDNIDYLIAEIEKIKKAQTK